MTETEAEAIAAALGGRTWNSGGGVWLVLFDRLDGKLIVLSDDAICEYDNMEGFEKAQAKVTIVLH